MPRTDSTEPPLPEAEESAVGPEQAAACGLGSGSEAEPAAPSERELIEAAKREPGRFSELYEANFVRVYGFIVRRVRDRALAEDLTADVFQQALANLPRFEWRGVPFGAWLIRIAANAISDRSKRTAREQQILTASQAQITQLDDSAAGAQAGLEEGERSARLLQLVNGLPEDQRRVITMRFAEEKSIREIARDLGRTEGAVKQLQFRGLKNLRAQIGELGITN